MTGQVHWLPFVILLIAVSPVFALWITGRIQERRFRNEKSSVRCRIHGNRLADLVVIRDAQTGDSIGIKSCSEFQNPEDVRCTRSCLPLLVRLTTFWKQPRAPSSEARDN